MADVWLGRFSRWVEKVFNAKGGPVLVDVAPSVQPVLSLDKGVDQRYLEGWNRFSVVAATTAVAANFGRVRLRNPTGSNVIVVIEQITVTPIAGADNPIVTWGATTSDLIGPVTLSFTRIDPRGNPTPTLIITTNQQAAGGQPLMQRGTASGIATDFINNVDQQLVNLPGQAIDIQIGTANLQANTSIMWRERALEQSELT